MSANMNLGIGPRSADRSSALRASALILPSISWMCLALLIVMASWVGFLASDDAAYAHAARQWLASFPVLPESHWAMRHSVVLPIAVSFALFGEGEVSIAVPTLVYWALLVLITTFFLHRMFGQTTLAYGLLVLISIPLFAVQASIPSADIAETFFIALSLWLFATSSRTTYQLARLFACGLSVGMAFLARDTALSVILFIGICGVLGWPIPRRHFLPIAAGALLVYIAETLYYVLLTGDPFYRARISVHHDSTVNRAVDLAGNVLVHPALDPLLMLAANQEFALVFVLGLPLGAWLFLRRSCLPAATQTVLSVFLGYAAFWFVLFVAVGNLLPLNPRYAMGACYATAVAIIIALASLQQERRSAVAALLTGAFLTANVGGLLIENRHPHHGEVSLVSVARGIQMPIAVDPETAHRAVDRLRWSGLSSKIRVDGPMPGELYFFNPARIEAATAQDRIRNPQAYRPEVSWERIETFAWPQRPLAGVLRTLGLSELLPGPIAARVFSVPPAPALYLVK